MDGTLGSLANQVPRAQGAIGLYSTIVGTTNTHSVLGKQKTKIVRDAMYSTYCTVHAHAPEGKKTHNKELAMVVTDSGLVD